MSWDDADESEYQKSRAKPTGEALLAALTGSEATAYREGHKCGKSPTGMLDQNPYGHRERKKRKAWMLGWLDGGDEYIQKIKPLNDKVQTRRDYIRI